MYTALYTVDLPFFFEPDIVNGCEGIIHHAQADKNPRGPKDTFTGTATWVFQKLSPTGGGGGPLFLTVFLKISLAHTHIYTLPNSIFSEWPIKFLTSVAFARKCDIFNMVLMGNTQVATCTSSLTAASSATRPRPCGRSRGSPRPWSNFGLRKTRRTL